MRRSFPLLGIAFVCCLACSSIETVHADAECPSAVPRVESGCDVGAKVCTYCPGSTQCTCFDHSWRCNSFNCADSG